MAEEEETSIPMHTDEPLNTLKNDNEDDAMSDPKDGSESDSESDSDDEAVKLQIQTLESELYANPSNYDAHVQVITSIILYSCCLLNVCVCVSHMCLSSGD